MPANLENSAAAQDWKKSVLFQIPKKGSDKNVQTTCHTIALISYASKVMLKILQARFQQYLNCELPDIHAGYRKDRRTRDQFGKIC